MRTAMAGAEVGDDWFGDDPTVNRLQDRAAEVTGKEAALYVPTGTMANQIGIRLHVHGSGHLVAATSGAHVASTELMTSAVLSGITFRTGDPGPRAWMTADLARELVEAEDPYDVEVVDLIAVENTVGHAGGTVMPVEEIRAIRKVADDNDLPIHLDGARIFNAAVAAGVDVTEYTREADTMMFCVSKGLGAPIGSLVCGTREDIREARRLKILFGGAWRQAGIMAAAGLIALEEGPKRLHLDHERARRLAEAVAEILPNSVDPAMVETNMVYADTEAVGLAPLDAIERLRDLGVGATFVSGKVRMVTHVDVDDDGLALALDAWRTIAEPDHAKDHRGDVMGLFTKNYPEEIAVRIPPGQRLVKSWPVLHYGPIPKFDGTDWDLEISGLVEHPFTLTYAELQALPHVTVDADMHCVTGWTTLDNTWEGVSFKTLLEMAKPTDEATWVIAHSAHGYTSDLSLQAMSDDDVLVAWRNHGEDLTAEHGWPLRLVVPKRYAWKSAKWLTGLEFSAKNTRGFWEVRGYHIHAEPFAEERYSYQEGPRAELEP